MRLWISLLSMNEAWEKNWIANEEDRRVVSNDIPNAVISVELDSITARIACRISGTAFTTLNSFCF